MMELFSEDARRNPYPLYDQIRAASPVLRDTQTGLWMLFDYESVNRALTEHETFSSRHGPVEWMIFLDPPRHSKLRGLISQAFTPGSIVNLQPSIRELSQQFLDRIIDCGEMDVAADFSMPFIKWNVAILNMSHTVPAGAALDWVVKDFRAATAEMSEYLDGVLDERRHAPKDDLLTRLLRAELDGERLTHADILGFFQLLLLAGNETTTNLVNNAILCFIESRATGKIARSS